MNIELESSEALEPDHGRLLEDDEFATLFRALDLTSPHGKKLKQIIRIVLPAMTTATLVGLLGEHQAKPEWASLNEEILSHLKLRKLLHAPTTGTH